MSNITQTLEQAIYGYEPNEFMPIYEGTEWVNRSAFIAYKIKRAAGHLGDAAMVVVDGLDTWIQSAN